MALVLASAANVQPDTALAQALRDYEAVLSNDQRSRLHSHRGSVPNAAAAINLTTEIDQENNGRMGRGVGPRFITFLESLQQFSSVLDTFVSSNPQMAALVWGGVKLALLAVKNVTSYFDKLSMLFMSIGRTSPRFNQFGLLYSTSPGLQKALCDYYAVIVHLCKHVIEFTQKPAFSQISSAFLKPFDVEFAPFQGQLQSLSQAIRDETSLAANRAQEQEFQLQAFERREASKERSLLSVFRDRTAQEQEETQRWRLDAKSRKLKETRRTFLDALSAYDHQTAWKQARKQCLIGTSTWIQHTQSFIDWLRRSSSASLWCTGKLGSGKTVSAACVVTHLMTEVSSNDVISFFFCRYDDPFSLKARTIIGSLLRQLLNDLPVVTFVKLDQQASDDILDVDQIVDLFESTLPRVRQYFIVVDGLDECDESETKDFFKAIKRLLQIPELRIKFYCSGRPNLVTLVSPRLRPDWHIMTDSTEATTDINHFIDITLEQCLEDGDLRLGDPALILTIQNTLRRGAQGMFLWVSFQIRDICAQTCDEDIISTLKDLPEDLPKTFERILRRLYRTKKLEFKITGRIFRWLSVAKRPMVLEELREAISIEIFQDDLYPARLVNDMTQALECCGNLVCVEEEQKTVHFTHHSVKQYLLTKSNDGPIDKYHVDLEYADDEVGGVCMTYLSFGVFNTHMATTKMLDMGNIPLTVLKESLPRTIFTDRIALKLLKDKTKPNIAINRQLQETTGDTDAHRQRRVQHQYFLLEYAKEFWYLHTKALKRDSKQLWALWCRLVDDRSGKANKPWLETLAGSETSEISLKNLVRWVVQFDHGALLDHTLKSDPQLSEIHSISEEISIRIKHFIREMLANKKYILLQRLVDSIISLGSEIQCNQHHVQTLLLIPLAAIGNLALFKACVIKRADMNRHYESEIVFSFGLGSQMSHPQDLDISRGSNVTMIKTWSPLIIAAAWGNIQIFDHIYRNSGRHSLGVAKSLFAAVIYNQCDLISHVLDGPTFQNLHIGCRHYGWIVLNFMVALGQIEMINDWSRRGFNSYTQPSLLLY